MIFHASSGNNSLHIDRVCMLRQIFFFIHVFYLSEFFLNFIPQLIFFNWNLKTNGCILRGAKHTFLKLTWNTFKSQLTYLIMITCICLLTIIYICTYMYIHVHTRTITYLNILTYLLDYTYLNILTWQYFSQ